MFAIWRVRRLLVDIDTLTTGSDDGISGEREGKGRGRGSVDCYLLEIKCADELAVWIIWRW